MLPIATIFSRFAIAKIRTFSESARIFFQKNDIFSFYKSYITIYQKTKSIKKIHFFCSKTVKIHVFSFIISSKSTKFEVKLSSKLTQMDRLWHSLLVGFPILFSPLLLLAQE